MANPVDHIQFVPDQAGVPVSAGTAQGHRNYPDGMEPFSVYLTKEQVQAELDRIARVERPEFFAQSGDGSVTPLTPAALATWIQAHPSATMADVMTQVAHGAQPDLRDVARKVAWDCWVDRLPAHTPPPAPPAPPAPPTPIAAPDISA